MAKDGNARAFKFIVYHKSLSILLRVLAIYVSARDPASPFRKLSKYGCGLHKLKTCRRAGFLNVCGPEESRTPYLRSAKPAL